MSGPYKVTNAVKEGGEAKITIKWEFGDIREYHNLNFYSITRKQVDVGEPGDDVTLTAADNQELPPYRLRYGYIDGQPTDITPETVSDTNTFQQRCKGPTKKQTASQGPARADLQGSEFDFVETAGKICAASAMHPRWNSASVHSWWGRDQDSSQGVPVIDNPNIQVFGAYQYTNGTAPTGPVTTPPSYLTKYENAPNGEIYKQPEAYWNSYVMGDGYDCGFRLVSSYQQQAEPQALEYTWHDGNKGSEASVEYNILPDVGNQGVFKFNTSAGAQLYGTINLPSWISSSQSEPQKAIEEDPISQAIIGGNPVYQRIIFGKNVNNKWKYTNNKEDGAQTAPTNQNDGMTIEWSAEPSLAGPWFPQFQPNTPANKYILDADGDNPSTTIPYSSSNASAKFSSFWEGNGNGFASPYGTSATADGTKGLLWDKIAKGFVSPVQLVPNLGKAFGQVTFNGGSGGGYTVSPETGGYFMKAAIDNNYPPQNIGTDNRYTESILRNFVNYDLMDIDGNLNPVIMFYSSIWNVVDNTGQNKPDWYAGVYDGLEIPEIINYLFKGGAQPKTNNDFTSNPVKSTIVEFEGLEVYNP